MVATIFGLKFLTLSQFFDGNGLLVHEKETENGGHYIWLESSHIKSFFTMQTGC